MKQASSLALVLTLLAGTAQAANTVRLKVEDHFGNSTEQQFDINVTAGSSGATWIRVPATSLPGSGIAVPTFGVMKYEARGTNPPVSTPDGNPYVASGGMSTTNANNYCKSLGAGYHLITEAQWLAIAHNAIGVAKNWTSGAVGTGKVMRGAPYANTTGLAASNDDANGYLGVTGVENRRTIILSNGEVIWDLAGNIAEQTWCDSDRIGCGTDGTALVSYMDLTNPAAELNTITLANADMLPGSYTDAANNIGLGTHASSTILRGANYYGDRGLFSIRTYSGGLIVSFNAGFRCTGP